MERKWQDVLITDERLDKVCRGCDRWTRIMAVAAVSAALLFIIIPAILDILK